MPYQAPISQNTLDEIVELRIDIWHYYVLVLNTHTHLHLYVYAFIFLFFFFSVFYQVNIINNHLPFHILLHILLMFLLSLEPIRFERTHGLFSLYIIHFVICKSCTFIKFFSQEVCDHIIMSIIYLLMNLEILFSI